MVIPLFFWFDTWENISIDKEQKSFNFKDQFFNDQLQSYIQEIRN